MRAGPVEAPRDMRYHRAPEFRNELGPYRILVAETGYTPAQQRNMAGTLAEMALHHLD